ncbi:MAG: hypothetical protein ACYCO9_13290 [Streptosporangiaceae bacterium]
MAHVLVVVGKVLAMGGFAALFVLFFWYIFPRSAGRARGSMLVYAGGVRTRRWAGSWGTVRLELGGEGLVIRGRGPFSLFIDWETSYGEITQARAVRAPGVAGLYLDGPGGPIAFWTPRSAEILDLLDLRAVPVSRTVAKVRRKDFT